MVSDDTRLHQRNKWTFSVGTVGRDMVYAFMTAYLIYFLTNVALLSNWVLGVLSVLILATRLVDVVMDVVMGSIVDNTRSRWGQYKPWIFGGVIASATFTILLFTDLGLKDVSFIISFELFYLGWSFSWTANDVPYWSLMPALTLNQKRREEIGSLANIFASIGQFSVAVAVIPLTQWLGGIMGDRAAWLTFVVGIVVIMLIGQSVTLLGTKVPDIVVEQQRVKVRDIIPVVFKNDQLLWVSIALLLFMTGYNTTISFGTYFFQYAYRDVNMYSVFAGVVGVATLSGFAVFPVVSRHYSRRTLYTFSTCLVVVGYLVFFFSPMNLIILGVAGLALFFGTSFVTVLMLVSITDTIDYGHWKLGHRNTAITFALRPFINKAGAALATEIVAVTVIISGINAAKDNIDAVTPQGLEIMKIFMLVVPMLLIVVGYVIYRAKYRIDEAFHARIIADLRDRGQLVDEPAFDEPTAVADAAPDAS